jgi:hypothetical protein
MTTGFRHVPISCEPLDPASDCIDGFGGAPSPARDAIRRPRVHAYVRDRGRAWVESCDAAKGTAAVRFDPGFGVRGRIEHVRLESIDFSREWKF